MKIIIEYFEPKFIPSVAVLSDSIRYVYKQYLKENPFDKVTPESWFWQSSSMKVTFERFKDVHPT